MNKLPIILATLLSGGSFWLAERTVNDLPARVNVDGRLLRLRVEGEGSPAVVLEIGLAGALEEWAAVQPELARFTKVAAYDRIGAVDNQPTQTGEEIARELHAALHKSGVDPPYVLVGQSFGGIYNRVFANLYPAEVAGLVLLDPSMEEFIAWMKIHHPDKIISNADVEDWPEGAGIWATLDQLKSAPTPDVPVIVATGTRPGLDPLHRKIMPVWVAAHANWVKTLPHGRHVLSPQSGHGVHVEAPKLVVALIRDVVEQVRLAGDRDRTPHSVRKVKP